jgi:hypothetical protein
MWSKAAVDRRAEAAPVRAMASRSQPTTIEAMTHLMDRSLSVRPRSECARLLFRLCAHAWWALLVPGFGG